MYGPHLPFCYWFIAIHLLTSTRKKFSIVELQQQLGHKRYESGRLMLHKLREAMCQRNALDELTGTIDLDEGFFTTEKENEEKDKLLKRGHGSQRKIILVVMIESKPVEGQKTKKGKERKVGHPKMVVVDDLQSETIDTVVKRHINKELKIDPDNSTSYTNLKNSVAEHCPEVIPKEQVGKLLPWVQISQSIMLKDYYWIFTTTSNWNISEITSMNLL
jgi:hypothetical protein